MPTTTSYDCASEEFGTSNEYCELNISSEDAATWYVTVYGYSDNSASYTLKSELSKEEVTVFIPDTVQLISGQSVDGTVSSGSWTDYKIESSDTDTKLSVTLKNLSDDADLFIAKDFLPDSDYFDCVSF